MNVELVRGDIAQQMRDYLTEHSRDMDLERRKREEAESRAIATSDELWIDVVRLNSKEGQPTRCRGTCVAGLPAGVADLVVEGVDADECLFEARWAFVGKLRAAKLCATQEDARARASRATVRAVIG